MHDGLVQPMTNEQGVQLNNDSKYSSNIRWCLFNKNKLDIPRDCDTLIPLYINSDKEIKYVEFKIGGKIINILPVEFCNKLQNFNTKQGDDYIYKLNWELFCKEEFYLIKTQFQKVEFRIISDHNCNSKLYYRATLYYPPTRYELRSINNTSLVKCFDGIENVKINEGSTNLRPNAFAGKTNGFFIDKIDYNEVNSIKIQINGHELVEYDNFMLKNMVKNFGSDIIYLDLGNTDYSEFNFNGSLNLSSINQINIQIDSNIEQDINIFYQQFNLLEFAGGMAALRSIYYNNFKLQIPIAPIEVIKKKIEGDVMCLIAHDDIKKGDRYQTCEKCKKNFWKQILKPG